MRKNVLIYPSNAFNAEEIYYCLRDSLRYKPILGNHGSAHCEFLTQDFYHDFPLITEDNFFSYLNAFIDEKNIEFIIPTHDTVADFLANNQEKFKAILVCSDARTANICRHKRKTYELFSDCSFVPTVYTAKEDICYPVFAKDDIGQGGKGSGVAADRAELDALTEGNQDVDYVFTEYLPGEEITVDCFTDRHRVLQFWQPRLRKTVLSGMSGFACLYPKTDEIAMLADTLNNRVHFRGYWYFQCKKDAAGHFKLMEIATRFAGTFSVSKNLDVNLPLLALTDLEGLDVKIVPNHYEIESSRGYQNFYRINYPYDHVYIDFDDTIAYQREKYIVPTMAFLFQCLNKGIKITLLTRHAYDIRKTMDKLFIDSRIFDSIIEVEEGKRKSDYIKVKQHAIFVDNSFAERLDVKEHIGIPTFDVCNLDCLLEM